MTWARAKVHARYKAAVMQLTKTSWLKCPALDITLTVVSCSRICYQWKFQHNFEPLPCHQYSNWLLASSAVRMSKGF